MRDRRNWVELGQIRIYLFECLEVVPLSSSLQFAEYWAFVSEFGEEFGTERTYEAFCDLGCLRIFDLF